MHNYKIKNKINKILGAIFTELTLYKLILKLNYYHP